MEYDKKKDPKNHLQPDFPPQFLAGLFIRVNRSLFGVHGLTDHAARQFHTALWLAELGYRTILFDLLGHGGHEAAIGDTW